VIEMEVLGVRIEIPANTPVLILRERPEPHRLLPIYIGGPEASAIHQALEAIEAPRPLTHDLFAATIGALGWALDRIEITEVRDHTFYAELHLVGPGGETLAISARPSDAVALATRTTAPVYANAEVLDLAGQQPEPAADHEAEILDEFRDFIEHVSPDDFAG
jgi:bifunctional DNase/RNase